MPGPFEDFGDVASAFDAATGGAPADVPFWGDAPAAWDSIYIDGKRLPGVVRAKGKIKRSHSKKKTQGKHGATVTYLGEEPAEFEITLELWTQAHLTAYIEVIEYLRTLQPTVDETTLQTSRIKLLASGDDFADRLAGTADTVANLNSVSGFAELSTSLRAKRDAAKAKIAKLSRMKPVTVVHPTLVIFGIRAAFVVEFDLLEPSGEGGKYKATWKCVEAFPEELRDAGGTSTSKSNGNYDLTRLGPGAVGRAVGPSLTNRSP